MDTKSRKLKEMRSFKLKRAGSSLNKEDPEIDYRGYISLKDVLTSSSMSTTHVMNNDENMMINSSNISIKNVLVKHAASAYVQSAFLVQRDTNCLTSLLERIRDPTSCGSCWYIYVTKPLDACFRVGFQLFHYMIDGISRLWKDRITIS